MLASAYPASYRQHSARILVVDDDSELREAMAELLEDSGYIVVHAANGREALAYLRSDEPKPDLVLLDLAMPVMDGWACHRELRADPSLSGLPVVIVSGEPRAAVPVPAARYLAKPFNAVELASVVLRNLPGSALGPR